MGETEYAGIDYGRGMVNVSPDGYRFGVISQNEVLQAWADSASPYYGKPTCPKCGNEVGEINSVEISEDYEETPYEEAEFACHKCKLLFGAESAYPLDPISFYIDDGEYEAECGEDGDIFITKSPYFTKSQFCSPCAPGAGNLMNPCDSGPKTYCFGHDWFEGGKAPYPVYDIQTGKLVNP